MVLVGAVVVAWRMYKTCVEVAHDQKNKKVSSRTIDLHMTKKIKKCHQGLLMCLNIGLGAGRCSGCSVA